MVVCMYAIFDTKLKRWNVPFFARNDQEAGIILLRSGIPKMIYDDIELYRFGEFSDDSEVAKDVFAAFEPVKIILPPYPVVGGVQ